MNGIKTYGNSYLYTKIPDYEKKLLEYVMKADRIDKQIETFSGIIEDVKRRQSSAVLSRVLMRDDVVLSIYSKPLPAAFKVFACKDVKTNSGVKVFIDCSGLLVVKNGFFVANKIDILCTYLLAAMTMLVYNTSTMRILTNSTIIQSGTECFVSLASHIFDYFRPNGYAENKNKIAYILAMYFQVNMLNMDRQDMSTKNLAAKVSGVQSRDINAMEIYYETEDLINIDTLVTSIADSFKMKGMDTAAFVEKWTWFYGVGTQFGCELFTAFAKMITDAYCGSYVNNQKTIEKCCGRSMVDFTNAVMRVGQDCIDQGFRYESSIDRDSRAGIVHEFLNSDRHQVTGKMTQDDYKDPKRLNAKIKEQIDAKYLTKIGQSAALYKTFYGATVMCDEYIMGRAKGYPNIVSNVVKEIKPYLNTKDKEKVINMLQRAVTNMTKMINEKNKIIKDMGEAKKTLDDGKKALKMIDPKNPLVESYTEEEVLYDSLFDHNQTKILSYLQQEQTQIDKIFESVGVSSIIYEFSIKDVFDKLVKLGEKVINFIKTQFNNLIANLKKFINKIKHKNSENDKNGSDQNHKGAEKAKDNEPKAKDNEPIYHSDSVEIENTYELVSASKFKERLDRVVNDTNRELDEYDNPEIEISTAAEKCEENIKKITNVDDIINDLNMSETKTITIHRSDKDKYTTLFNQHIEKWVGTDIPKIFDDMLDNFNEDKDKASRKLNAVSKEYSASSDRLQREYTYEYNLFMKICKSYIALSTAVSKLCNLYVKHASIQKIAADNL